MQIDNPDQPTPPVDPTPPAPEQEEKIQDSWMWIKGSDGNASVTTTFAFVAFWVTTIIYVLSVFEKIGPVTFRAFDPAACAAYLIPILGAYWGRRHTESQEKKQ